MTDLHNPCVICRDRAPWADRLVCVYCYKGLRADLAGLAEAYAWVGECMVALPSTWREHTIHARPAEAPAPAPLHLLDLRARISANLLYWAAQVATAKRPVSPAPAPVVSVTAAWLERRLGWITRQHAVALFAGDVAGLLAEADKAAPRPEGGKQFSLPCPCCNTLGLAQYGGPAGLIVCWVCRRMLTAAAYTRLVEAAQ